MKEPSYTSAEYLAALRTLDTVSPLSSNLKNVLREHLASPGKAQNARVLARTAKYKDYRGINLLYGKFAKRLAPLIGWRTKGSCLRLIVEFAPPRSLTNREWILVLRPEFATAVRRHLKLE